MFQRYVFQLNLSRNGSICGGWNNDGNGDRSRVSDGIRDGGTCDGFNSFDEHRVTGRGHYRYFFNHLFVGGSGVHFFGISSMYISHVLTKVIFPI